MALLVFSLYVVATKGTAVESSFNSYFNKWTLNFLSLASSGAARQFHSCPNQNGCVPVACKDDFQLSRYS